MKNKILILVFVLFGLFSFGQNHRLNELTFKKKYTIAQRDALSLASSDRQIIYVSDTGVDELQIWDGDSWETLGSNYIPLSGTEVGSPVTGDIKIQEGGIYIESYDVNDVVEIFDDGGTGVIKVSSTENSNYSIIDQSSINITKDGINKRISVSTDNKSFEINAGSESSPVFSRGLDGTSYYGANYDDNTYIQKKYADDNFIPLPTEGTDGQVLTTDGAGAYTWEDASIGGSSFVNISESGDIANDDALVTIGDYVSSTDSGYGIEYEQHSSTNASVKIKGRNIEHIGRNIEHTVNTGNSASVSILQMQDLGDGNYLNFRGSKDQAGISVNRNSGATANAIELYAPGDVEIYKNNYNTFPNPSVTFDSSSIVSDIELDFPSTSGTIALLSDITGGGSYTDEQAQDAIGAALADTSTINATYADATPEISFDVIDGSIDTNHLHADVISEINSKIAKPTEGTDGQVLTTDGAGDYTWEDGSGGSYSNEQAQDAIAAAISAGTSTRISIGYDDANNLFNFTVDDDLSSYDNSTTQFLQENTVVSAIDSELGQTDWKLGNPTASEIETLLDAYYSNDDYWRTQLTASEIETLLDTYYGNTDWRSSGGSSTAIETTSDNSSYDTITGTTVQANLNSIDNAIYDLESSNDFNEVYVDNASYTLIEADMEAMKPIFIEDTQTDVTITIPSTSINKLTYLTFMHQGSGILTVISDTGVNELQFVQTFNGTDTDALTLYGKNDEWRYHRGDNTSVSVYIPPSTVPAFNNMWRADSASSPVNVTGLTPSNGDLLIAYVAGNTGNWTAPSGWTLQGSSTNGGTQYLIYSKLSDGTETSAEFTTDGSTSFVNRVDILSFTGVHQTTPITEFNAVTAINNTDTITTGSMTSSNNDSLAVYAYLGLAVADGDGTIQTIPRGTEIHNVSDTTSNDSWFLIYDEDVAIAGTVNENTIQYPINSFMGAFNFFINPE